MKISQEILGIITFMFIMNPSVVVGEGTPWNITPRRNADADGGTLSITVNMKGAVRSSFLAVFTVPGGMTPPEKAAAIAEFLDRSSHLTATVVVPTNTVKVEIQNGDPAFDEIEGIEIRETGTGEGITKIKDDPPALSGPFRVFFVLDGTGITPDAAAFLQIGDVLPLVSTSTEGRSSLQIEEDLISAFNAAYVGTGYTAVTECGGIVVANVPCPEGIAAGSDDSGLSWSMGMFEGTSGCFPILPPGNPALPGWAGIALAALLVVAGIIVFGKRRTETQKG